MFTFILTFGHLETNGLIKNKLEFSKVFLICQRANVGGIYGSAFFLSFVVAAVGWFALFWKKMP